MTQHAPQQSTTDLSSHSVADQARGVAEEARGAARDVVSEVSAAGTSLRNEATGLGSTIKQGLSDQVEQRKNGVADRLSAVAERAQQTADELRGNEAWLGNLVARGAEELRGVAEEIRRNDVPGILGSVEVFARRQPALFMGASVALGFAMTRIVAGGPSASDHYARGQSGRSFDTQPHPSRTGDHAGRRTETPVTVGSNI